MLKDSSTSSLADSALVSESKTLDLKAMEYPESYEVIVVGCGHAGAEVASCRQNEWDERPFLLRIISTLSGKFFLQLVDRRYRQGHSLLKELDAPQK